MNPANGPRKFRMVPYTLSVAHRKIGNRPAQYVIRSPPNMDPPPVLQPFGEGDYADEVTEEPEIQIVHEEPGCSYEAAAEHEELPEENLQCEFNEEHQEDPNMPSSSTRTSPLGREVVHREPAKKAISDPRFTYPSCYVEPSRRWTYKSAGTDLGGYDYGQEYDHNPDPFRPAPSSRGGPCAAERMHYAAKRVDSVKYSAQISLATAAKGRYMDSAVCDKCNLRFFLPMNQMRSQISYGVNHYQAFSYFACPVCRHENQLIDCDKEYDY